MVEIVQIPEQVLMDIVASIPPHKSQWSDRDLERSLVGCAEACGYLEDLAEKALEIKSWESCPASFAETLKTLGAELAKWKRAFDEVNAEYVRRHPGSNGAVKR